jgi:hypothetical protein
MEITVTIPPSVGEHLRTYAASLFYETTPYAISRAVVSALINQLDSAGLVMRDDIVTRIVETSKPFAPQSEPTPVIEEPSPIPPIEQATAASLVTIITDPKKLKVPSEWFQGKVSNTWLIWGWCMASSLNRITLESGARKFHRFSLKDVVQGVMQRKKVRVKDKTAYSALDVLVKRQWLTFNAATKQYALSAIARKLALMPKNQSYLINKGFSDLLAQPDPVAYSTSS